MKLKEIAIVCDKGSGEFNEDIARVIGNCAYVIDGATGLNGKNLVSDKSDAYWFVNFWDGYLKDNINRELPIREIVRSGIKKSFEEYDYLVGDNHASNIDYPSASMAILCLREDRVEYFILGDCSIVTKAEGDLEFYMDKRISPFDNNIYKKMRHIIRSKDVTHNQVKELLKGDIVENRLRKNTLDGYWILEFDEMAVDNAVEGSFEILPNMEVAIMSDGFAAIVDKYHLVTTREAFEKGIQSAIDKLRKFEKEDINVKRIPRFKAMDDASCIHLVFVDK